MSKGTWGIRINFESERLCNLRVPYGVRTWGTQLSLVQGGQPLESRFTFRGLDDTPFLSFDWPLIHSLVGLHSARQEQH